MQALEIWAIIQSAYRETSRVKLLYRYGYGRVVKTSFAFYIISCIASLITLIKYDLFFLSILIVAASAIGISLFFTKIAYNHIPAHLHTNFLRQISTLDL